MSPESSALIHDPVAVLAVLLTVLAALFWTNQHPTYSRVFKVVPLLVFAYFVPTLLSNTGVIPLKSPLYGWVKTWLLPASLVLLTLSVDIPAVIGLGRNALILFFTGTAGIVFGAPLAYLALGWMMPPELGEQAWKGLAALSGSWIGGTANFVAIGESVGTEASVFNMMVVVDVFVASLWMAVLLWFAGREKAMDEKLGADRTNIDVLMKKVETFQKKVLHPATLGEMLAILALAFASVVVAKAVAAPLPDIGNIIKGFTWVVLIVTTIGVGLSFSPLKKLEGAGASRVGSVFLYLLVATIGAKGEFAKVLEAPAMVVVGLGWMSVHAIALLLMRRWIKAPIFYLAVGSQANVGGAASAPIVASAFHPTLAPVGVLLAVLGYVFGTYAGLLCAFLLQTVHGVIH